MKSQHALGLALIIASLLLILVLAMIRISQDRQGVFLCEAVEQNPDLTMEDCPAHKSTVPLLISGGFAVAFILLAVGVFLVLPQRKETKSFAKPRKLDAEEESIFDLIAQAEGSRFQGELVKESGFSKVKVTRILDRLETKGVIERKRRGMTNIVVLRN